MSTVLARSAQRALDETDAMSPELRQCVHEFGYTIVKACLDQRVTEPRRIRHLVIEIWKGARQPHQRQRPLRGAGPAPSDLLSQIDGVLKLHEGETMSAATLTRLLWQSGFVIVPTEPSGAMLAASMAEVSGFTERITKPEKHRRRLKAAIAASARKMWPYLFADEKGARS